MSQENKVSDDDKTIKKQKYKKEKIEGTNQIKIFIIDKVKRFNLLKNQPNK